MNKNCLEHNIHFSKLGDTIPSPVDIHCVNDEISLDITSPIRKEINDANESLGLSTIASNTMETQISEANISDNDCNEFEQIDWLLKIPGEERDVDSWQGDNKT